MVRPGTKDTRRTIGAFIVGGILASILFSWFVSRYNLSSIWFEKSEWWIYPTRYFWALATGAFFLGFFASYLVSIFNGWCRSATWTRMLFALCVMALLPFILSILSRPGLSIGGLLLSPIAVALFLSFALFLLTRRWYTLPAALIALVYLIAPLLADVPNLFFSGGYRWFDAVAFFLRCTFLMALCGWWIARTETDGVHNVSSTR
jgi:hypothetical protein